jgi:hypothetical protein
MGKSSSKGKKTTKGAGAQPAEKMTRTTRYLKGTNPRQGYDGDETIRAPAAPGAEDQSFVPRLGFVATPKESFSIPELCRGIKARFDDALFFCDNSIFDTMTDERLWQAILGTGSGRIVITPEVEAELQPWLARHPDLLIAKAIQSRYQHVEFRKVGDEEEWFQASYGYYANLLGFRKRMVRARIIEFERINGRTPDENEIRQIKDGLHKDVGERGYMLAKKGAEAERTANFYTDEKLVVYAALTAVAKNRPVLILSKDEDVLEQFYEMFWLLDSHYRAMLLADYYHFDSSRMVTYAGRVKDLGWEDAFDGEEVTLLEAPDSLLKEILPANSTFTPVFCWVAGESLSQMIFGAEREMTRLLQVKAETRGLNTKRFGGRNCHVRVEPLPVPRKYAEYAVIAEDRRLTLPNSPIDLPILDINQSLFGRERFRHVVSS